MALFEQIRSLKGKTLKNGPFNALSKPLPLGKKSLADPEKLCPRSFLGMILTTDTENVKDFQLLEPTGNLVYSSNDGLSADVYARFLNAPPMLSDHLIMLATVGDVRIAYVSLDSSERAAICGNSINNRLGEFNSLFKRLAAEYAVDFLFLSEGNRAGFTGKIFNAQKEKATPMFTWDQMVEIFFEGLPAHPMLISPNKENDDVSFAVCPRQISSRKLEFSARKVNLAGSGAIILELGDVNVFGVHAPLVFNINTKDTLHQFVGCLKGLVGGKVVIIGDMNALNEGPDSPMRLYEESFQNLHSLFALPNFSGQDYDTVPGLQPLESADVEAWLAPLFN